MNSRTGNLQVMRAGALVVATLLCGPAASAGGSKDEGGGGALSKVVGGIRERTGQQPTPPAAPAPNHGDQLNDPPPQHDHRSGLVIQPYWGYDNQAYANAPYPTYVQGGSVSLYAGIQSVADSDQSVSFALHSSYADWGIAIDDTRYFETNRTNNGMETIHLDVWSASVTHRLAQLGDEESTAVWLRGGLAGASAEELMVFGVSAGVEIAHNATRQIGLDASLRGLALQDGIRGIEARGGVAASVLRVGYRALKLDVGPALHGPELGLAWRF